MNNQKRLMLITASIPFVFLLLLIGVFLYSNPMYSSRHKKSLSVNAGAVSFAGLSDTIVQLKGNWHFWWAETRYKIEQTGLKRFAELPGSWTNAGVDSHFGYATYGLEVTGLDPNEHYALRIGHTLTACRIVVNGKTVRTIGSPGESAEQEFPSWDSVLARFYPDSDGRAEILLHISNYRDRYGGSNASIYLGNLNLMERMEEAQKRTEIFVFSVLSVMALFFLSLWFFRTSEHSFMWFAGICLVVGFRTLCYDGFVLTDLFPSMPWTVFFRLGYLTFPVVMILFIGFLNTLYPDLVLTYRFVLVCIVFGSYSLVILLGSEFAAAVLLIPFQFAGVAAVAFGVWVIVKATLQKRENAFWLFSGFFFAVVSFGYDILVSMWVISGYSLSHIGMSLCLFCLAMMVIVRYSDSFERARVLSAELRSTNRALYRFVPAEFIDLLEKDSIVDVYPGDCVEESMAVLAADIRSFTAISEKFPPDEIFRLLNEYYGIVAPIIRTNNGIIAKYEGDGFFALFPQGSESAVRAAVQMQSAVNARNRANPGKPSLQVGIGIDTGPMMLGTIGDNFRMDSTIISNCIRCAGTLQSATRLYQSCILINETVYAELAGPREFFLRPVDRIDVGDRMAFLFEVYNNDSDEIRELKVKTQNDFEMAIFNSFAGKKAEARVFLEKVLAVFPEDPVSRYYEKYM